MKFNWLYGGWMQIGTFMESEWMSLYSKSYDEWTDDRRKLHLCNNAPDRIVRISGYAHATK